MIWWKAKRAIFITKIDFSIHYEDGENGIREKENKRRERNGMRFIRMNEQHVRKSI
jgi:hypothetical protein